MKYALGIILILLLVGVFVLYHKSLDSRTQREAMDAETRECIDHLRTIAVSIEAAQLQDENVDLVTAISKVGRKEGYSFFRCRPQTNDWVQINPNAFRRNNTVLSNEASLYCPKPGATNLWVAINFAGDDDILSNKPSWTPVSIGEVDPQIKTRG